MFWGHLSWYTCQMLQEETSGPTLKVYRNIYLTYILFPTSDLCWFLCVQNKVFFLEDFPELHLFLLYLLNFSYILINYLEGRDKYWTTCKVMILCSVFVCVFLREQHVLYCTRNLKIRCSWTGFQVWRIFMFSGESLQYYLTCKYCKLKTREHLLL